MPPLEHTTYPLAEAATAIRVMSAAEHTGKLIGKLILSIPHEGRSSVVVPPERARVFRSDGAYIITGGLGGIGLFLAAGMAAAGCGRIVADRPFATQPQGPEDTCAHSCDRSRHPRGVRQHRRTHHRGAPGRRGHRHRASVRGVLHAAAVVADDTLTNITDEFIDRDWAPKVYGAWHLHNATAKQPLDWFCSFSSAAALLGYTGLGAYAAANSWLDGFAHWRRAHGLPATAIAWGAWAEIGRAAVLAEDGQTTMIAPTEGAYAFQTLLRHDRTYCGYVPIIGSRWVTGLAQRFPFAEAFQATGQTRTDSNAFRAELSTLSREEWPGRFAATHRRAARSCPAPHHRPGSTLCGPRSGLARQPRNTHPHRNRDRNPHNPQGDCHP